MLTEKIQYEKDEKTLILVRKHWFIITTQLCATAFGALLPLILLLALSFFPFGTQVQNAIAEYSAVATFLYLAWLLISWMAAWNAWTNYYLDVWIITNKRLIAIDQQGLFSRATGSFRLERLQDINVEINGIIATMLDYGTLQAQTAAGSDTEFRATGLPHPRELKAIILSATDVLMSTESKHSDGL